MDSGADVTSLRTEATRIRNLTSECRRAGIFLEDLPEEIHAVRGLVYDGRLDAALDRMRVIKLELLGRLLLQATSEIPPTRIENVPVVLFPPDSGWSAEDDSGAEDRPKSVRSKPPR